jgi:hypothetical protein
MTAGEEVVAAPDLAAAPGAAAAPAGRPRLQRTTTMLAYRKEPLAVAQQAAAATVAARAPELAAKSMRMPTLAEEPAGGAPAGEAVTPRAAEAAVAAAIAEDAWAVAGTCQKRFWSCPGATALSIIFCTYCSCWRLCP